jgi:hypothetical protein
MAKAPDGPYTVVYSEQQRRAIRALAATASRRGLLASYLAAAKAMHHLMETDPLGWGDPHNRLQHLGLTLCHGVRAPLHAYHAVDVRRRIVYVREVQPLPRHGFDEP